MTSSTKRLFTLAALGLTAALVLPQSATATSQTGETAKLRKPRIDRTIQDPRINESSGLARSAYLRHRLWTHNDSGGGNTLYALGRRGRTAKTYQVLDVTHWDWEGMARAKRRGISYLFVGDIGDNARKKDSIFVSRVREPKPGRPSGSLRAVEYEFKYPDGAHDAETLMVRPGSLRIFIVTKGHDEDGAIYRAPKKLSTKHANRLTRLHRVSNGITDGTFLGRHGRFVIRGYPKAYLYSSMRDTTPRVFDLPTTGESITSGRGRGYVLIGSERRYSKVWRVPLP